MNDFGIKDSGERVEYPSGMRRDTLIGKPRYELVDRAMLTRWAVHMTRGAEKYGSENWRLANSEEEARRFQGSAMRHLIQWMNGEREEDHAAAILFNVAAYEHVRTKLSESDSCQCMCHRDPRASGASEAPPCCARAGEQWG